MTNKPRSAEDVAEDLVLASRQDAITAVGLKLLIVNALIASREIGFHEGKEFAIDVIGEAMISPAGSEMPFLAYQEAAKVLKTKSEGA